MSKNDSEPCRDRWGVVYNSKAEMCEAHGVSKELYDARISRGFCFNIYFTDMLLGY